MLIGSSTDITSTLGATASGIVGDFKVYIFIIAGLVLGFYIIERLITAIFPQKYYGEKQTKDV